MSRKPIDFADFLRERDFVIDGFFDDDGFYAKNDIVFVRCINGEVHWGVRECFDRWANSTDFVSDIPYTLGKATTLLERVERKIRNQEYDPGFAEGIRL